MKNIIFIILIILCITFIFYNSSINADQSIQESGKITKVIEKIVVGVYKSNPPERVSYFLENKLNYLLRDIAHFIEFFILSILVILYSFKFNILFYKKILFSFLFCMLIAVIDELIQIFSPGRAFQFYDLMLDFLGIVIGITVILLPKKIMNRSLNKI